MDKKLFRSVNYTEIMQYRLPVYNPKSKDKVVTYWVFDPESIMNGGKPRMRRFRKKFCHIKDKRTRDAEAMRFCELIAQKLRQGWNPLIQDSNNKSFCSMDEVLNRYTLYINKSKKEKQITNKTYVDYTNRLKLLTAYIHDYAPLNYVYQFNSSYIEDYLEYVFLGRDVVARTRNNYLTWIRSFCTWLVNHGYLNENPCARIKSLRNDDKFRKALTKQDLGALHDYLEAENLFFLLACETHYYTLIRPNEMSYIKIGDISVSDQTIFVSKEISKNHRDSKVTLPDKVLKLMIRLGVLSYPSDFYLFGKNFHPSPEHADSRIFREYWVKVRKALGFPDSYQFYSLKDTGITDAIAKVGIVVVKDQARHQDVQTTNRYVSKEQLIAHQEYKTFDSAL